MPGIQRIKKVSHVVLMVGLVRLADLCHAAGPQMMLVCRLSVILKRLVVRNVVSYGRREVVSRQPGVMRATHYPALGIYARWREAALEPTPRDALGIQ